MPTYPKRRKNVGPIAGELEEERKCACQIEKKLALPFTLQQVLASLNLHRKMHEEKEKRTVETSRTVCRKKRTRPQQTDGAPLLLN